MRVLVPLLLSLAACGPKVPRAGDDPELTTFLSGVVSAVERHAWDELLDRCDPENVATQVDGFGMAREQYLAEILGLHSVGNSLDLGGDGVDVTDLDRLQRLEPAGPVLRAPNGEPTTIRGRARVSGGASLQFELMVVPTPVGLKLSGGVG